MQELTLAMNRESGPSSLPASSWCATGCCPTLASPAPPESPPSRAQSPTSPLPPPPSSCLGTCAPPCRKTRSAPR
ncbi:hypothetical protein HK405_013606, partial [Cladochytrium tenue]